MSDSIGDFPLLPDDADLIGGIACGSNKYYEITDLLGDGAEGRVFEIQDANGKKFTFKIHSNAGTDRFSQIRPRLVGASMAVENMQFLRLSFMARQVALQLAYEKAPTPPEPEDADFKARARRSGDAARSFIAQAACFDDIDLLEEIARFPIVSDRITEIGIGNDSFRPVYHSFLEGQKSPEPHDTEDSRTNLSAKPLVMSHLQGDNLYTLLAEGRPVGHLEESIVRAVANIHGFGIMHRDLHPGNILIVGSKAYILDLGRSSYFSPMDLEIKDYKNPDKIGYTCKGVGTASVGSRLFSAPDSLCGWANPSDDTYSLGLILCAIRTGTHPLFPDGMTYKDYLSLPSKEQKKIKRSVSDRVRKAVDDHAVMQELRWNWQRFVKKHDLSDIAYMIHPEESKRTQRVITACGNLGIEPNIPTPVINLERTFISMMTEILPHIHYMCLNGTPKPLCPYCIMEMGIENPRTPRLRADVKRWLQEPNPGTIIMMDF